MERCVTLCVLSTVFGYIAYNHMPEQQRIKLDDKSRRCIFIGYNIDTKGCKLYDPNTREVNISRDVQFADDEARDWSPKGITHPSIIIKEEHVMKHMHFPDNTPDSQSSKLGAPRTVLPARFQDCLIYQDDDTDDADEIMVYFCLLYIAIM